MQNFMTFQDYLLTESAESDMYEHSIAEAIAEYAASNNLPWKAERPKVGTNYSDVRIQAGKTTAWIEVKMNVTDQLGTPRFFYKDGNWQSNMHTPIADDICKLLQHSSEANSFLTNLAKFTGISKKALYLSPYKSEIRLADPSSGIVTLDQLKAYAEEVGTRYVMKNVWNDLDKVLAKHYLTGKAEPAQYIQIGDNFFMFDKHNNPLRFKNVPVIKGNGILNVRFATRSEFYEIQAEIKFDRKSFKQSPVSFMPDSQKQLPKV